jgi:hypothetical protein
METMKRIFLIVVILSAAIAAQADTLTLVSVGTSINSGQVNSMGSTIAITQHPSWAPALSGSSWVSFAVTGDPNAPGYTVVGNGTVVTFSDIFFIQGTPTSGWLSVMGDDSMAVLLNGNLVVPEGASLENTYATCSDFGVGCLTPTQLNLTPYLKSGENTLQFLVAQRAGSSFGLNYSGQVENSVPVPEGSTMLMLGTGLFAILGTRRMW